MITEEVSAAAFAERTGFPNPIFGLEEGARDVWMPLSARIQARANVAPDAFALAVYDAVWIAAMHAAPADRLRAVRVDDLEAEQQGDRALDPGDVQHGCVPPGPDRHRSLRR